MFMNDPEMVSMFIAESTESLADIENQLLTIESGGADIDVDLVNTVFRSIHSIKGLAGFLELGAINKLSHSLEDVLNRIRNRDLVPDSDIVDVMLRAADELSEMVAVPEESNDVDITKHVEALHAILEEQVDAVLNDNKSDDKSKQDADASSESETDNAKSESQGSETVKSNSDKAVSSDKESTAKASEVESPKEPKNKANPTPKASAEPKKAKSSAPAPVVETSIRVPISTLDQLMNLAGELVLNRNRLVQYSSSQRESSLLTLSSDIDQITCELQEAIMQTRMQPIANAFNRFPRIVRDLSSKLGKKCNLVVEGKDVEVDKSIIEAIGDPLTHLIRNSIDHGIEMPDERLESSKVAQGTIRLSAYHRAGQVCIDIEDDGGGIDPEKIKSKAVSKGVITDRQATEMSNREALRLIFHPGFSTADQLSDISGRGVGMDVVRTNIERIGGTVDIESEVGKGTTIQIVLPLTLAIIRSLIIGNGQARYAIPQVNVSELVRVSDKENARVHQINDSVVLQLRDELIPLVELTEVLGQPTLAPSTEASSITNENNSESDKPGGRIKPNKNIIVLETGRARYGLVVDQLFDSEEIVVKPLGVHLQKCASFAGATILGDGRVALILDVTGISDQVNVSGLEESLVEERDTASSDVSDTIRLLLFQNAPGEQFAIPMSLVARIERVETSQLEFIGGRVVIQYRGGTLPLIEIEKVISAKNRQETRFVSVVILTAGDQEYGVIAPSIEDICLVTPEFDVNSLQESGVIGSQVISGVTTRVLDVDRLFHSKFQNLAEEFKTKTTPQNSKPKILVAEDSSFFRKQLSKYLQDANYDVIEASDGAEALKVLESRYREIDLLLTDIEMPNMTGLELCEKVRNSDAFSKLPVIALTSLASAEDLERGRSYGVDDYQIKMDHNHLMLAIHRLLNN